MDRVNLITLCTLLILSFVFYGCTHNVAVPTVTPVEIHTSYDEKIPGNWAIIVDKNSIDFETEISTEGEMCIAHTFVFSPGESVHLSTINAFEKVFENSTPMNKIPRHNYMKTNNLNGNVVVELEDFDANIYCRSNMKCTVEVDIEFDIDVQGTDGKLLGATVDSSKTVRGSSGFSCGAIGELFSKAYSRALSDSLEEMAEEISNSSRIREYANN